ncbi:hypothetical protein [Grimontia hollisae]|uniref:hypothetical protein n=1 Tax=Grimontia hollisae TaxID=673 RepID=UPI0013034E38|nr:hypothetical protein [Grimontia hollisae]
MKGHVIARKLAIDTIYVLVEDGTVTTIETSDAETFEKNDIVTGELQCLGSEDFYNQTQKFQFDGFVQDIFGRLRQ